MASPKGDRPSLSVSSSLSPSPTPPTSSSSSATFTFRSHTPTSSADISSATPVFNFSPPPTGTAAPSSNPFQFGSSPSSGRTTQSPETRSGSNPRISAPASSKDSSASTTRAFSTASHAHVGSARETEEAEPADQSSPNSSRSPYLNASTYRDLHNSTPSPQPESSRAANQPSTPAIDSQSPSDLEAATCGTHDLVIRSIETPGESQQDASSDDESEFSDDESDDDDYTYSLREEELPRAPIYDVRLQNSLKEVRSHLANLTTSMRGSEVVRDRTTDIKRLCRQAKTLSKFEYPEIRIVGFIGDSGVGKSSLINSLLDHESLARSNGNGNACTSVVTEFRHTDETRPQPYTIEADFMTPNEQGELLQELLRDYRLRHTPAFHEINSEQEAERVALMSDRAWETLQSLFPGQAELTEEFLSDEHTQSEIILSRLEEWALAGLHHRPGGPEAREYRVEAADINHCREILDTLTVVSQESNIPAIWPFIKLIRVYLRSPILRTGLVVADLPGFRDLNYARVRAAERYLRHSCDEVFVVSSIGRCRSDQSIGEIKERLVRDQPLRIVCTKSESGLNAEESIRDAEIPQRVKTQARQLQNEITNLKKTQTKLASRRRRSSGARQARYATDETVAGDELQRLDLQLMSLLIKARNELAVTDLSKKYRADVKVFCVSSKLYADHREDNREQAIEYIQLSGIAELRRYCQSVPAEAQLRATATFLETRVPALVGSLNGWILRGSNSVSVERAATLRRVLDEAQQTLRSRIISRNSCIRSLQADLTAQFRDRIIGCIRESQGDWETGAIDASRNWRAMHHSTYAAFCRKHGVHQARGGPLRYWNNEVIADAKDELGEQWSELLDDWLPTELYEMDDEVDEIFDTLSTSIEEHTHLAPEAIENLLDNLDNQKSGVADTIHRAFDSLNKRSLRISLDTLEGHSSSSYIAEIMRPAYDACNDEAGRGSDAKRKKHMDNHLRYSQMFSKLSKHVKKDYKEMTTKVFDRLRDKLGDEVANITRDLGAAIAVEGELTEPGRDPQLAERVRTEVGELQTCLDEALSVLTRLQGGAAA